MIRDYALDGTDSRDRPRSSTQMFTRTPDPDDPRLLTEARTLDIYERLRRMARDGERVAVNIQAWWQGELRWARNQISVASDRRDLRVWIGRKTQAGVGQVWTNQIDDAGLTAAMHAAEFYANRLFIRENRKTLTHDGLRFRHPLLPFPHTAIWSDATTKVTPEQRAKVANFLSRDAEAQGMLSAGYLQMRIAEQRTYGMSGLKGRDTEEMPGDTQPEGEGVHRVARHQGYVRYTEAQCSMTVRHPKGIGSGWTGLSTYDWSTIDGPQLAQQALEKCIRSLNPVAIEPGRYTVILEPPAVAALATKLVDKLNQRKLAESIRGGHPFFLEADAGLFGVGRSKLGLNMIDERITLSHNPMHPALGIIPDLGLQPITWIKDGVLQTLSYQRDFDWNDYSLQMLNENIPQLPRHSYEMSGGETTVEEMITGTRRGILVSRLIIDPVSIPGGWSTILWTGVTRDGLWLIENGKISKAVKNMRWTESPLFVFNRIEQIGVSVPVFNPGDNDLRPIIVPTLKTNDFAFTATIDAV